MTLEERIRVGFGAVVGMGTGLLDWFSTLMENPIFSTVLLTLLGGTISWAWPMILDKVFKKKKKKVE